MYQTGIATGLGATAGVGALGSALPHTPVLDGAHQVLAFTGFAFGAYILVAVALILSGLVVRKVSAHRPAD